MNNIVPEKDIKETISLTVASKTIKYLGINLIMVVKDLYVENFKTLMKKTKEDTNKWENILCSWTERVNIVTKSILHKATHRYNAILVKISMASSQ